MKPANPIRKSKTLKILLVIIVLGVLFLMALNFILESAVKSHIDKELFSINQKGHYTLSLEDVDLEIFEGDLVLEGFSGIPADTARLRFEQGEFHEDVLKKISVSRLELKGVSVFDLLFRKEVNIDLILLDEVNLDVYKSSINQTGVSGIKTEHNTFSIDSINLPNFTKIVLNHMEVDDYGLHLIDFNSKDTISSLSGKRFLVSGLKLDAVKEKPGFFSLNDENLKVNLESQQFDYDEGLYEVSFETMDYDISSEKIQLTDFKIESALDDKSYASRFEYAYLKNAVKIDSLFVYDFNLNALLRSAILDVGLIDIQSMSVDILRDKTKPYDKTKHIPLPTKRLEDLNHGLHIKQLQFQNTTITYSELLPEADELLSAQVYEANGKMEFITSLKDSLHSGKALKIDFSGNLLNALTVNNKIEMSYATPNHAFRVSGYTTGTSDFEKLNPILYPTNKIKLVGGKINGLSFNMQGDEEKMTGELTMRFTDLEVELHKKNDSLKKNLTWLANQVIKKSNPNKNGKLMVSKIDFKRVTYKEMDHYMWKSVETGIINSLVPAGNRTLKKID